MIAARPPDSRAEHRMDENGGGERDMEAHARRIGWVVLLEIAGKGSRRSIRTGKIRPDLSPGTQDRRGDVPAAGEDEVLAGGDERSEEHTSELQSPCNLVCRLLLEKKKEEPTHTSVH